MSSVQIPIDSHIEGSGWTDHGRYLIAAEWFRKGLNFYQAGAQLHAIGGHPYVCRNLLCQAIEICGKSYLLHIDFSRYEPKLKRFGHDLVKLAEAVQREAGVRFLTPRLREELHALSQLYSKQHLRYASGYDLLVDGSTISAGLVGRRFVRLAVQHVTRTYPNAEPGDLTRSRIDLSS